MIIYENADREYIFTYPFMIFPTKTSQSAIKKQKIQEMEAKKRLMTLDNLYISPFTKVRRYDDNGLPVYTTFERNLHPTGIYAADPLLQSLTNGETTLTTIARRNRIRPVGDEGRFGL